MGWWPFGDQRSELEVEPVSANRKSLSMSPSSHYGSTADSGFHRFATRLSILVYGLFSQLQRPEVHEGHGLCGVRCEGNTLPLLPATAG